MCVCVYALKHPDRPAKSLPLGDLIKVLISLQSHFMASIHKLYVSVCSKSATNNQHIRWEQYFCIISNRRGNSETETETESSGEWRNMKNDFHPAKLHAHNFRTGNDEVSA